MAKPAFHGQTYKAADGTYYSIYKITNVTVYDLNHQVLNNEVLLYGRLINEGRTTTGANWVTLNLSLYPSGNVSGSHMLFRYNWLDCSDYLQASKEYGADIYANGSKIGKANLQEFGVAFGARDKKDATASRYVIADNFGNRVSVKAESASIVVNGGPIIPKVDTDIKNAQLTANAAKKVNDKALKVLNKAKAKLAKYKKRKPKTARARAKWKRTIKHYERSIKASKRRYDSVHKNYKKYQSILDGLKGQQKTNNLNSIKQQIAEHQANWHNEGKCAIYGSDGATNKVIFISPSSTESETESENITSWPVDKGAPRSDHARMSSVTKSVSGIITGETRAIANQKYQQLKTWDAKHTELTYVGDIVAHNLLISELSNNFTGLTDNLEVSITFTYVQAAEVKVSRGNNSKKKKSKSSKTTRGSRNKRYTAITIKPGDTLWALSRKYGKSVAWLARVNHIKNPNRIYAGRKLYVSAKKRKKSKKMRVR